MDDQTTSTGSTGSNNQMMVGVIAAVVVLLGVGAVAYKERAVIKSMFAGQSASQSQTPAPAAETTPAADTPQTAPNSESPVTVAAVEVDYAATGFSPKSITVKKGQTVKFVNKTTGPMSVASNPHPTHTDYPAFDQYKSSAKGQAEYDFTFDKVGTWGYHNHAKATDLGTVVVTE